MADTATRPVPAAERGRLELADRVVEKVAVQAALGCPAVVATAPERSAVGDVVQRVVRTDLPRAEASVAGDATRVRMTLAVRWPAPLPETTRVVSDRVAQEVSRLTGLRVDGADVEVTSVVAARPSDAAAPAGPPMAAARPPVRSTRVVVLGCLAALVLAAVGVLAVQSALVELGWLLTDSWWTRLVDAVGVLTPQPWWVAAGVVSALVGLWLLLVALRPGRRPGVRVGSATGVWMTRRDVARFASGAAEQVDGVLSAATAVRRRSLTVSVRTTGPDVEQLVRDAVSQRLSVLDPHPTVVVRQRSIAVAS